MKIICSNKSICLLIFIQTKCKFFFFEWKHLFQDILLRIWIFLYLSSKFFFIEKINEKHYVIILLTTAVLALKTPQKNNKIAKSKLCWSFRIVRKQKKIKVISYNKENLNRVHIMKKIKCNYLKNMWGFAWRLQDWQIDVCIRQDIRER